MNIFKSITLLTALLMTHTTNAALITDYQLDALNNVVTDTDRGIEWLQWDATGGMSINQALATHSADGWGLATNVQVAALFNDFDLSYGSFVWDDDEETYQTFSIESDGALESQGDRELLFVDLFGDTWSSYDSRDCQGEDCMQFSGAKFGSDQDGDGEYNHAHVMDDHAWGDDWERQDVNGYSAISPDNYTTDNHQSNFGVALSRAALAVDDAVEVDEPITIALWGLALFGLLRTRRIQK